MKHIAYIVVAILFCSFIYSTDTVESSDPDLLIGKWKYAAAYYNGTIDTGRVEFSELYYEFRADNTCELSWKNAVDTTIYHMIGTYKMNGKRDKLTMYYGKNKPHTVHIRELTATTLVFGDPANKKRNLPSLYSRFEKM